MLRFSANISLLFTEYTLLDRFKAASDCGFTAVEIQFPYELPAELIAQALDENDLQLVLFNVAADDLLQGGEGLAAVPEKQNEFRKAVALAADYAQVLNPNAINVLSGRVFAEQRRKQYLATFIDNLQYAVDAFATLGIKTVFEAINTVDMPGFLIYSSAQMLAIVEQIDHPSLAMQYDIYHCLMMAENPSEFISQHADKIGHIQFADMPGRGQPGTGNVDFSAIFEAINNTTYSGWVGAEYKPIGATIKSLEWLA